MYYAISPLSELDSKLVGNHQTCNSSTGQSTQNTTAQSTDGHLGNISSTTRGNLTEHTDLGTQTAQVTET
eukprot:c41336_g1_i1 orf=3-209(-)